MAGDRNALHVIDMLEDFVRPGAPLEAPGTRGIVPAPRRGRPLPRERA